MYEAVRCGECATTRDGACEAGAAEAGAGAAETRDAGARETDVGGACETRDAARDAPATAGVWEAPINDFARCSARCSAICAPTVLSCCGGAAGGDRSEGTSLGLADLAALWVDRARGGDVVVMLDLALVEPTLDADLDPTLDILVDSATWRAHDAGVRSAGSPTACRAERMFLAITDAGRLSEAGLSNGSSSYTGCTVADLWALLGTDVADGTGRLPSFEFVFSSDGPMMVTEGAIVGGRIVSSLLGGWTYRGSDWSSSSGDRRRLKLTWLMESSGMSVYDSDGLRRWSRFFCLVDSGDRGCECWLWLERPPATVGGCGSGVGTPLTNGGLRNASALAGGNGRGAPARLRCSRPEMSGPMSLYDERKMSINLVVRALTLETRCQREKGEGGWMERVDGKVAEFGQCVRQHNKRAVSWTMRAKGCGEEGILLFTRARVIPGTRDASLPPFFDVHGARGRDSLDLGIVAGGWQGRTAADGEGELGRRGGAGDGLCLCPGGGLAEEWPLGLL